MSAQFRELLQKVGSGSHTSESLTREEAAIAMQMMLEATATPAQIGAFLIAHRIKRPTAPELAGMYDTYTRLGALLPPIAASAVTVLGNPYDGRSRYVPVTTITALLLAAAGVSVILHGGDRLPTKYGMSLLETWQGLGVDFSQLNLGQMGRVLENTGLGFVYLPRHFPQAQGLVPYREQLGKRPPVATLELIWSPYEGECRTIAGFVHPPTENLFRETLALLGKQRFTTVKGLEGSCDLARSRTAIIGINREDGTWQRLHLHPIEYGFGGKEVPLESQAGAIEQLQQVLAAKPGELLRAAIWNGGFYLWHCGVCADLETGFAQAEAMLSEGVAKDKLAEISAAIGEL